MRSGIRQVLRLVLGYPWHLAAGIGCLLSGDALQLVIPLIVRRVIDRLTAQQAGGWFLPAQAGLLCALALGIVGFRFGWRHFFFSASRMAEIDLRKRIYLHAQALSPEALDATSTGEIMALSTNDVESVRRALAMGLVAGLDGSIFAVAGLLALFWLAPSFAYWVVLPLPLLAIVMKRTLGVVYQRWDEVQRAFEVMNERTRESIAGIRIIKAFCRERAEAGRFQEASQRHLDATMRYLRIDSLLHPLILLLTGSCTAILLGLGGSRVLAGKLSLGTLVALSNYLAMLTWPMIAVGWMFTFLQRAAASMERIQQFLARPTQEGLLDPDHARSRAALSGDLVCRDLTFRYPGRSIPALSGVCFHAPAGSSVGIIGEIGAGKSTLFQLLLCWSNPPRGALWLDGQDLIDFEPNTLLSAIAWVPQEAFLFSDTIESNLRMGKPEATAEEMKQACGLAGIPLEEFADGLDTVLGERGITISGGQKQRLALARAFLKDAPILLLDDTLSAVDSDRERQILAALEGVRKGRTLLLISHRISAVRDLDQILVLQEGRVVEQGNHEALMDRGGIYRRMADLQTREGAI